MKEAITTRGNNGRLIVNECPYCKGRHYHGDGTRNGSGKIDGTRVADCGGGQYDLIEEK